MGIHHITAIVGNPQENIDFYTSFLGLRLVKKTVNFDDPYTYHLYFGDKVGKPGTAITFSLGLSRGKVQLVVDRYPLLPMLFQWMQWNFG